MDSLAGRPYWRLHFEEDGTPVDPDAVDRFLREVGDERVEDLVVLSHGWNNSPDYADTLYETLLPLVVEQASGVAGLGRIGLVGVHWPSIWWPDEAGAGRGVVRGGDAQSSDLADDFDTADADPDDAAPEPSGAQLAAALGEGFPDAERTATLRRLGELVDEGEAAAARGTETDAAQRERLTEFHALLTGLLPAGPAPAEDSGEKAFLDRDDPEAFVELARAFGSVPETGDAQGVGDLFRTVWRGAKDGLRVFSYYTMKARAGVVGREGLGPVLTRLRATRATAGVRVHLVGHSFGGRLVAYALAGLPSRAQSPVASLVLVQAAFSHFAFAGARDNPFGSEGALRTVADRVHGPLVTTWSEHDWAVGRWYPRASALARQDNQDRPEVSRWGAMGAGGFQSVEPLEALDMVRAGGDYGFAGDRRFYSVDSSRVIADWKQSAFSGAHSDILRPEVGWLVAAAAAAGARAAASG